LPGTGFVAAAERVSSHRLKDRFKEALQDAADGIAFNNMSAIVKYSVENGPVVLWMGDMETCFMEDIEDEVAWPKVDILFAPHHGRDSGKIPQSILDGHYVGGVAVHSGVAAASRQGAVTIRPQKC
jgi:hypothetical protein